MNLFLNLINDFIILNKNQKDYFIMNDAIVAINIFDNDVLINKDKVPILFYWQKTTDVISSLQENDEFVIYISNHIKCYDNSYLTLIYFELDDNNPETEEAYQEFKKLMIQDLFSLDKFEKSFIYSIVISFFYDLFNICFKEQYINKLSSTEEQIIDICKKLKAKYKQKLNIETIINYIYSKLNEETQLNSTNINILIKRLREDLSYANI